MKVTTSKQSDHSLLFHIFFPTFSHINYKTLKKCLRTVDYVITPNPMVLKFTIKCVQMKWAEWYCSRSRPTIQPFVNLMS